MGDEQYSPGKNKIITFQKFMFWLKIQCGGYRQISNPKYSENKEY